MTTPARLPASPSIRLSAGSPAALLAIIPHLLGFSPGSSLVVIGTGLPEGKVKVTLRYDLPDPADPGLAGDIAGHAVAVLQSQGIPGAVTVGYGPDQLVRPVVSAFADAAGAAGIRVLESLRADDGRYWSYSCSEACCPAAGVPSGQAGHPLPAALADSGARVLADRTALSASIAPVEGTAATSMREVTSRAERHVTQVLARLRRSSHPGAARRALSSEGLAAVSDMIKTYRGGGKYATDYQLAWLTVVLKDLRVRDDAWARMDPEHVKEHQRMWTDVVRRARPGHIAPAASLLAFTAWQAGNGALANVALDRAMADDPAYSMAQLLRQVITAGAPPSMARLPMTPEEVAACYDDLAEGQDEDLPEDDDEDREEDEDEDTGRQLQPATVTR
jgi:hypothetical protein